MWIRWIRIRIRNTGTKNMDLTDPDPQHWCPTVADDVWDEPEPVGQLLSGERARPRRSTAHGAHRRPLGFLAGRNVARNILPG